MKGLSTFIFPWSQPPTPLTPIPSPQKTKQNKADKGVIQFYFSMKTFCERPLEAAL